MERAEFERRDQVIRAYFKGRDWDGNGEFALKRRLVLDGLLKGFPFVIDDEWEVVAGRDDQGRGDLVFTDGNGAYAVVEVKFIDLAGDGRRGKTKRVSNRKKRRKVEEQAVTYAQLLFERLECPIRVDAYSYTNEHDAPVPQGVVEHEVV